MSRRTSADRCSTSRSGASTSTTTGSRPCGDESGIDVEYRRIGTLEVALDPKHAADLRRQASEVTDDGVAGARGSEGRASGARLRSPARSSRASHGYVAAPQLTTALARAAERQGTIFRRARVHAHRAAGSSVRRSSPPTAIARRHRRHRRRRMGRTPSTASACRRCDLSAASCCSSTGAASRSRRSSGDPSCYVVPRLDGSLLVGATVEDAGFDERTTAAGMRDLLDAVGELLPEAKRRDVPEARAGLRPATPDELPVIGSGSRRRPASIHASGHYRNGVLLAPITAKLIGDLIVEGKERPALTRSSRSLLCDAPTAFHEATKTRRHKVCSVIFVSS